MPNQRILIQDTYPQLLELGIPMFGFYDIKVARDKLDIHDHGNCYEICYLEKGMQPYYIHPNNSDNSDDATIYNLYGGEVFITHPHERHSSGEFNELRGRMYWINIDMDCPSLLGLNTPNITLLKKALSEIKSHIIQIPLSTGNRFKEAHTLFHQPSKENIFCACQLLSLFIMELSAHDKKQMDTSFIDRQISKKSIECMSFIDNNILNPELDVKMIADHLNYSKAYTMTIFRNETGMSVHEYIMRRKIEYARDLLETHSITETAFMLNFSSSQHFSKVFKSHTLMTPRSYKLSRLK